MTTMQHDLFVNPSRGNRRGFPLVVTLQARFAASTTAIIAPLTAATGSVPDNRLLPRVRARWRALSGRPESLDKPAYPPASPASRIHRAASRRPDARIGLAILGDLSQMHETKGRLDRGNGTELAWIRLEGAGPTVVFLPGFRSDMTGDKATALAAFCAERRPGDAAVRLFGAWGEQRRLSRRHDRRLGRRCAGGDRRADRRAAGPRRLVHGRLDRLADGHRSARPDGGADRHRRSAGFHPAADVGVDDAGGTGDVAARRGPLCAQPVWRPDADHTQADRGRGQASRADGVDPDRLPGPPAARSGRPGRALGTRVAHRGAAGDAGRPRDPGEGRRPPAVAASRTWRCYGRPWPVSSARMARSPSR